MPITLLDGILVGFTLVSAMLAMVRGFSREVLSVASWAAAAAAAFFFYKPVVPYVQPYIDNEKIAMAAAAGIVFIVALIVVTIITMKIADFIIDSRIGALDRTLGFLYGAARGILVVAVGLLFFNWLVGDKSPAWVSEAKSRPLLESIGTTIENMLPEDPENSILKKLNSQGEPEAGAATPPAEGGADEPAGAPAAETPPANN
ncbi:CvpA family protein [Aminobacter sp. P9b]|uniref:Membrane protein required for colicin V production n=1 Tax=Aminobacter niigataensis TaxID=83265 RepID=A0ABR6L036_9HYPH|nr:MULTISPECIES: CvpA family protein [Aminobacter]AWC24728.1 Pur regulon 18 kDa protein [Aminobacter sp. MSH1]MBB4650139.1 membrane protein required for colicin V production [Aminobacter niigataensis]CAI2935517.1 Colicin V production protein [Aminobacter niigataensis]